MSNFEIFPILQGTRSYGKYGISNPIFCSKYRLKCYETNTNIVYSFRSIQLQFQNKKSNNEIMITKHQNIFLCLQIPIIDICFLQSCLQRIPLY